MPSPFQNPYDTPVETVIEWRLPMWAALRFEELLNQLERVEDDSDEAYALKDEIRSLPGFPHNTDPDRDLIYLVVTTLRSH